MAARLDGVPVAVDQIWNPATCPAHLLPWLAWGLSLDLWNADWTEAQKRDAVADAISFQQRKGTPASLRVVLDRFDPLIGLVEWFEDRGTLDPYTFRLELPLVAESDVIYDEALVGQILRDIAQVKPVRAAMQAVFRLRAAAAAWLLSAARLGDMLRFEVAADVATAGQPEWLSYLLTSDGEPLQTAAGAFLEA
ncbi:phage tail protein I [Sphingomonas bisphenolicum]